MAEMMVLSKVDSREASWARRLAAQSVGATAVMKVRQLDSMMAVSWVELMAASLAHQMA